MLKEYDLSLIKGMTAKKLERLNLMGLTTVQELIDYYPYRYENYQLIDLKLAQHGEKVTVEGELHGTPYLRYLGSKRNMLTAQIIVDNRMINLVWFNRGFLKKQLAPGRLILVTGKWDKGRDQITVAESSFLDTTTIIKKGNIMPIYSVPADFYLIDLQKIMRKALDQYATEINEYLPAEILSKYRLPSLRDAVLSIHFPVDEDSHKQARRRLIYDELLQYQLRLQIHKKRIREEYGGNAKPLARDKFAELVRSLPYNLTADQESVIEEIFIDLERQEAMNRLLQGDVGSGKTIVAIITLYANYLAGFQGAFMVPTEILANQHKESLDTIL
jgi:ATP-dependent DNA helicase RecG